MCQPAGLFCDAECGATGGDRTCGAAPFGRLALALGLPRVAALLFDDPGWRGGAWYRAGEMDRAAADFAVVGQMLNLGNAEIMRGHHAAALEAYDRGGGGRCAGGGEFRSGRRLLRGHGA